MQKWIYSRTPRKPFVVNKLSSFDAIPSTTRKFQIKPSQSAGNFYLLISLSLIIITCLIIYLRKDEFLIHSNYVNKEKANIRNAETQNAFKFLNRSGIARLQRNQIKGAYSEFKLALKIYPDNLETNQLMLETLSILCVDENKYCKELDEQLFKMTNL